MLKMKNHISNYKNYNQDDILWSKDFFNYTIIFMELFDTILNFLHLVLYCFYIEITDSSIIYK